MIPSGLYLIAFSFIPHKELRFLFPIFPTFSLIGASFSVNLYAYMSLLNNCRKRNRPLFYSMTSNLFITAQILLFILSLGRVYVSSWNYPGGHSIVELSKHFSLSYPITVHVDSLTTMTGFTRFVEDQYPIWKFEKAESVDFSGFDFLISSNPAPSELFEIISHVDAFAGFSWYPLDEIISDARVLKLRLPFHMKIIPTLFIQRRLSPHHPVDSQSIQPVSAHDNIASQQDKEPTILDHDAYITISTTAAETIRKDSEKTTSTGPSSENLKLADTPFTSESTSSPTEPVISSETISAESRSIMETSSELETLSTNLETSIKSGISSTDVTNENTYVPTSTSAPMPSSTTDSITTYQTSTIISEQSPIYSMQNSALQSTTEGSGEVEFDEFGDDSLDDEL